MRIGGASFAFDPFASTTLLNGSVDGNTLKGEFNRPGGNHQKLLITFSARALPDPAGHRVIEGVLTSANCTWDVWMTRE